MRREIDAAFVKITEMISDAQTNAARKANEEIVRGVCHESHTVLRDGRKISVAPSR